MQIRALAEAPQNVPAPPTDTFHVDDIPTIVGGPSFDGPSAAATRAVHRHGIHDDGNHWDGLESLHADYTQVEYGGFNIGHRADLEGDILDAVRPRIFGNLIE